MMNGTINDMFRFAMFVKIGRHLSLVFPVNAYNVPYPTRYKMNAIRAPGNVNISVHFRIPPHFVG